MSLTSFTPSGNSPMQVISPGNSDERIFSLDVLRGLALLGILVISIGEFGGFISNQQIFYRTGTHGGNYKLLTAVSILFEGKMRALFALVFGAGIILFLQKKEHPVAIGSADAYIRRQMWLMFFGVFNAFVLLWPGDILFQYGVVGILLFAFYGMKTRGLFICAIVCMLIYCGKMYWNYTDDKKAYKKYVAVTVVEKKFKADSLGRAKKDSIDRTKDTVLFKDTLLKNKFNDSIARKNDTLTKEQAEEKGAWEGLAKGIKYDSSKTEAENKSMRASYLKVWKFLMVRSQNKESFWLYRIGIWDIGSMMLWGMALFSLGFFGSRFSSSKYLLVGLITLITGLALAWLRIKWGDDRLMDFTKYVEKSSLPHNLFFPVERLLMTTGYASLVLWLIRMGIFNWLWKALGAAGKMAFTNYIMQTVICTFFFYGYGFGYFGRLQQWELYFIVAEIALVQIVFSVFWLRYYTMGPLEWLWRCLIYRKRLPIKKLTSAND